MKILNLYAGIGGNRKLWGAGHAWAHTKLRFDALKETNKMNIKYKFWLIITIIICLSAIIIAFLIFQTEAIVTFHLTSDNNTLEIFKTINYSAIGN